MKKENWIEIPETEIIHETEKAILLRFYEGVAYFHYKDKWIPKSCYRIFDNGVYEVQQVKSWFYWTELN